MEHLRHDKFLFTEAHSKVCQLEAEDQYSVHHKFSRLTTEKERAAVEKMVSYINERGNPFDISVILRRSLTSGEQLDDELVALLYYYIILFV